MKVWCAFESGRSENQACDAIWDFNLLTCISTTSMYHKITCVIITEFISIPLPYVP